MVLAPFYTSMLLVSLGGAFVRLQHQRPVLLRVAAPHLGRVHVERGVYIGVAQQGLNRLQHGAHAVRRCKKKRRANGW